MKILMHSVYFPPEIGGMESHIYYLCRALVQRGHEVHVVTSRSQPGLARHEVVEGIEVSRTWLPMRNTPGWAAHAFGSMPKFGTLAKRSDVMHAQDIASVLPCMVAKRVSPIPIVTTYHTSHFLTRAESPFWRPVFARFVAAGDHNFAASDEIAAVASSLVPSARVESLTNGVETEVFLRGEPSLPSATRPRLIVPRRLFEKNGVEFFVRAMPLIAAEVDVEAIVVGDGPERRKVEQLAASLGVTDRIDFMGARAHKDMPGLFSSCDLAIFPSLMEATSVAALESMACEVPVAASRVGGLPEIVDDEVGGLFEPGDPESLAEVVVALLRGDRLRALGSTARRRVIGQWSNDRLAERHIEVYEELVSRRPSA